MQLTVASWDDRVFPIELDDNETLSTLQAILEAESNTPAAQQQLVHNGRPLPASASGQTLSALGIANGDVLMLLPAQPQGAQQQQPQQQRQGGQQQPQQQDPHMALAADGAAVAPAAFIQAVKAQPELLAQIAVSNPPLAAAIRNEDVEALQTQLRNMHKLKVEEQEALRREDELLAADPFDPDAQRRIEEIIHKRNIEENFALAMEHNPEVFASVEMLYVNMEVNGVPVKAFVDSGAQMTIMTQNFASKCYLTRLMDTRFAGMAVGVGSSKILGRIHQAPLKVGGHFTTCSITVLEQKDGPQFIFGLDMLKRHLCVLDLAKGNLTFGSCDATLHFLPEHEIPRDFKRHIDEVSKQQAEQNVTDARNESSGGAGPSGTPAAAGGDAAAGAPAAAKPGTEGAAGAGATPMDATPSAGAGSAGGAAAAGGGGSAGADAAVKEADVQQLIGLGFSREMAEGALRAAGGNVDNAASMLFGM